MKGFKKRLNTCWLISRHEAFLGKTEKQSRKESVRKMKKQREGKEIFKYLQVKRGNKQLVINIDIE